MRKQEIELKVDKNNPILKYINNCSLVIGVTQELEREIGKVREIVLVDDTILATIEFNYTDRVLSRMLGIDRCGLGIHLSNMYYYEFCKDRYSNDTVICLFGYEPDLDFD